MENLLGTPFLAELEARFARAWVCVGSTSQLPGGESRFVHEEAGRSLLICRDAGGRLGAFVNACSHRGTRLCAGPGQGRIQCPYHGWVFGCDGRLLGATRRAGLPEAFDEAEHGLRRLAVAQHGPLLFVHGDVDAAPLDPDVCAPLQELALGRPFLVRRLTVTLSWREALEGHTPFPPGPLAGWLLGARAERAAPLRVEPNLRVDTLGGRTAITIAAPLGPALTRLDTRLHAPPGSPGGAVYGWLARRHLTR